LIIPLGLLLTESGTEVKTQGRNDPGNMASGFGPGLADPLSEAWDYLSLMSKIARKASWGMSTFPTRRMRFLPAFCFSRTFILRV
jgi:hypothetical protein